MAKKSDIKNLFDTFDKLKVLIIGDVMLDTYVYGNVERISPEAPVPVLAVEYSESRPGGAANVAMNIRSLGAKPYLISIAGTDEEGDEFIRLLEKNKIDSKNIIRSKERITTSKTRVIAKNHQMLRLDKEKKEIISSALESAILNRIKHILQKEKPDVVIFEDYDKGLLTEKIIQETIAMALREKIPVAVDPKKNNFFSYTHCTLFKPNLRELNESLSVQVSTDDKKSLTKAAAELQKKLHHEITLITLGDKGIYLSTGKKELREPAYVRNVSDVSGAGDTVISVAALCLAAKTSSELLIGLCNLAGGLVCEYAGVVPVNKKALMEQAASIL